MKETRIPVARRLGRPEKYPFDEWFDGEVHILEPGIHWADGMALNVFRITVNQAARRKHIIIRTEQTTDGNLKVWKVGDEDGNLIQPRLQANEVSTEVPVVELDGREPPHSHI